MKKNTLTFLAVICFCSISFSQLYDIATPKSPPFVNDQTNQIIPKSMNFTVLPYTGAGSPWARIPGNTARYQRNHYLVRASEIANSGFPSGSIINEIGFNILSAGEGTQTGHLKVYMKNTTDETNMLGSSWNINDFTLVADIQSWTVPIDQGAYTIPFSGGQPFIYASEGVYVAFEFSNPSGAVGTVALSARCNDNLSGGVNSSQDNSSLPTTIASSSFRPVTEFINNSLVDIVQVQKIYTLEKVPVGYSPSPIDVLVKNVSNELVTFEVNVKITNIDNTITYYTSSESVTNLDAESSTLVNFTGWSPIELEDVIITAEISDIAEENWLINNAISLTIAVTSNTLSYNYDNSNSIAFGYNHPNTGLFLSKYRMIGSSSVSGVNIVIPEHSGNPGNSVYAVVLNSAGTILAESEILTIQSADQGTTRTFNFPIPVSFENEDYYVGVAQNSGSTTWRPLGVFTDNPRRANTFYTANINGGSLTELEAPFNYKFGIEAIIDDVPLSISEEFNHQNFVLFPNPVNDMLQVKIHINEGKEYTWSIYDINGKIIISQKYLLISGMNKFNINLEELNRGIYIFQMNVDGIPRTGKIIKE